MVDRKKIIQTVRDKTWLLLVALFWFGFGISAYVLNSTVSTRNFIQADFFKTNYFPSGTGPEFVFILITIISILAALFLTEVSRNTAIFSLKKNEGNKITLLTLFGVALLLSISVFNFYLTYESYAIADALHNTDMKSLAGFERDENSYSLFKVYLFAYILAIIYPWLLVSLPVAADRSLKLFRENIRISDRPIFNRKCLIFLILLIFVIPMFSSSYFVGMLLISRGLNEFVPSLGYVFGISSPLFYANLYLFLVVGIGIYLVHVFSIDRLKSVFLFRINHENLLFFLAVIGYLGLIIGADLLVSIREDLMIEDAKTLAALRGEEIKSIKPIDKTWVDESIWWSVTTLGFMTALLAGFITKTIRCVLIAGR